MVRHQRKQIQHTNDNEVNLHSLQPSELLTCWDWSSKEQPNKNTWSTITQNPKMISAEFFLFPEDTIHVQLQKISLPPHGRDAISKTPTPLRKIPIKAGAYFCLCAHVLYIMQVPRLHWGWHWRNQLPYQVHHLKWKLNFPTVTKSNLMNLYLNQEHHNTCSSISLTTTL